MIHRFTSRGKLYGLAYYVSFQALKILYIEVSDPDTYWHVHFGITRKPFQYEPYFRVKSIFL